MAHLEMQREMVAGIPSVDWWITNRCNLSCDFCYGPSPGNDQPDQREEVLRSLSDSSARVVTFCGGEPLLVRRVDEYAGVLHKAGKRTVLNTNGTFLTRRVDQGLDLRSFDLVGVSIDGSTAETHRAMRGPNASFQEALSAARLIAAEADTRLKIGTVVSAVNQDDIDNLARLINGLRPEVWRLYQYSHRVYGQHGWLNVGQQRHELSEDDFHRLADRAAELAGPVPVARSSEAQTAGCFIVDPAGTVLLPTATDYQEYGSCRHEPLDDIWARIPEQSLITANKRWLSVLDR